MNGFPETVRALYEGFHTDYQARNTQVSETATLRLFRAFDEARLLDENSKEAK